MWSWKDSVYKRRKKSASQEQIHYSTACYKQPDENHLLQSSQEPLGRQRCAYKTRSSLLDAELPAAQLITS